MFNNEMKEKKTKEIQIEEIDPSIVQEMLKFIYTGKCSINDKDADPMLTSELLKAAHRYQVDILTEMCGDELVSTLNPGNALELLELADMFRVQGLKTHALDMVVSHVKTIRGSAQWKECAKKSPNLFVDITEAVLDRFTT